MKPSVYYPGIACTTLMLAGCMFKVMHWPGANALIILPVFLFCFYFLPVALIIAYKSQETPQYRSLYIITYVVFSICLMSVLFRVLHWPGVGVIMQVALPLPFVVFLPAYLYHTRAVKKENSTNFLGLTFGLIFLAVFSVLLALGTSRQVLRNAITRLYTIETARRFEEDALTRFKTESAIRQSSDDLCTFIEDIKRALLNATQGNGDRASNRLTSYHWGMENTDDRSVTNALLFSREESDTFEQLREKVNAYRATLLATRKMSPELTGLVDTLFNTGTTRAVSPQGDVTELDWEQREFANRQLVFVLGALTQIQSNARLVELEYLASLR